MCCFALLSRNLLALWISLFALALVACSSSSPEDVVKEYCKAVADNRVDDAIAFFSLKDVKENDLTQAKGKLLMIVGKQYSEFQGKGGLESVATSVIEPKKGDSEKGIVRVKSELKFKNGETQSTDWTLVQESGKWKFLLR